MTTYDWIRKLPGVIEAHPVTVEFGEPLKPGDPKNKKPPEKYDDAVRYLREFDAPEGCAKPGRYVQEMVYVKGKLPLCMDRQVCFTVEGDTREWYLVGGFYGTTKATRRTTLEPTEFNPFGNAFMLGPWDDKDFSEQSKGEKIDHYEDKPYDRVRLAIVEVKPVVYDRCHVTTVGPNLANHYDDVTVSFMRGVYSVVSPDHLTNLQFNTKGEGLHDKPGGDYARFLAMRDGKPLQTVVGHGEGI